MPREWEPLTIPLVAGEAPSADDVARRQPTLSLADNVHFPRDGGISSRPPFVQELGQFWTATRPGTPTAGAYGSAGVLPSQFPPRGLVTVRAGDKETPLYLADGRAFVRNLDGSFGGAGGGVSWHDVGVFWSCRVRSLGFATPALDLPGTGSYGAVQASGGHYLTTDFTVHADDGQRLAVVVPTLGSPLAAGMICPHYLGGQAGLVYNTSGGALLLVKVSATDPHAFTEHSLAVDARTTAGQFQSAYWDEATTSLYVAYLTTVAGQVKILKVSTAGAVTATQSFTNANQVIRVALSVVDARVVVAFAESAGTLDVKSKVFNTSLVDQAIDVTIPEVVVAQNLAVGPGQTNQALLVYTADSSMRIISRSTTAAGVTTGRSIPGFGTGPAQNFRCCWAPWRQNGTTRCMVGFTFGALDNQLTWVVIDVTDVANDDQRGLHLVAHGLPFSTTDVFPLVVDHRNNGTALVGSPDFTSFSELGGEFGANRIARLEFTGQVPVAESAGAWLLGGATTHYYDGSTLTETGFIGAPDLRVTATAGAGLATGTYALVAVWSWTDALGKVHRSAPSDPFSVTTAAGVTGQITWVVTNCIVTKKEGVKLEVYMSAANPPASGAFPMYLAATADNSFTASTSTAIIVALDTAAQVLYTTGGVLENFPPPGSDGGIASAGSRVWAASGSRVAASKLVKVDDPAPAWNELLEVVLPTSGGDVVALIPDGDGVIAVCERAAYQLGGDYRDNLLQGPEPRDPSFLGDVGGSGARAWAVTPAGVFLQSADNTLYQLGGGSPQRVARAVDSGDTRILDSRVELVHWPALDSVVAVQDATDRALLVYCYRTGQWTRWTTPDFAADAQRFLSACLCEGLLYTLTSVNSPGDYIGSFNPAEADPDDTYQAGSVPITGRVHTSWIRLDGDRARGWARAGNLALLGRIDQAGSATILVDRDGVELASPESHTVPLSVIPGTPATTWPTERFAPEVRLARQKCSTIRFRMSFTGVFALAEMELDVRRAGPAAPPGQRVS